MELVKCEHMHIAREVPNDNGQYADFHSEHSKIIMIIIPIQECTLLSTCEVWREKTESEEWLGKLTHCCCLVV